MTFFTVPDSVSKHFNFFRVHLAFFTFTPLIVACFFYAANGSTTGNANSTIDTGYQHVEFIDALFTCYSAMTVTGLVTINLSATQPFQQFLLFFLMIIGDYSVVSLAMVIVRKHFFRNHCEELLKNDHFRRTQTTVLPSNNIFRAFTLNHTKRDDDDDEEKKGRSSRTDKVWKKGSKISGPINARPMENFADERPTAAADQSPKAISPSTRKLPEMPVISDDGRLDDQKRPPSTAGTEPSQSQESSFGKSGSNEDMKGGEVVDPDSTAQSAPSERKMSSSSGKPSGILQNGERHPGLNSGSGPVLSPNTPMPPAPDPPRMADRTIQVIPPQTPIHLYNTRQAIRAKSRAMSMSAGQSRPSNGLNLFNAPTMPIPITHFDDDDGSQTGGDGDQGHRTAARDRRISLFEAPTMQLPTDRHLPSSLSRDRLHTGFGGPPGPIELLSELIPTATRANLRNRLGRIERKMTLVHNEKNPSFASEHEWHKLHENEESWGASVKVKAAQWLPESLSHLVVGRNSRFFTEELNDEDLEMLGGVEYRALRLLSYLVSAYIILFNLIPFAVSAIYFSQVPYWDAAFVADSGSQAGTVNKYWAALIQTVASYTGAGLSLVDSSLLPFSTCYVYLYSLDFAMLAGNHALPMVLRLIIWIGTKIFKSGPTNETLHFLLDHPRRCFLYLFPSHQTWYLTLTFLVFTLVEMSGFLILNIGLDYYDSLPGWQRFSDGLIQSLSVRAAGFGVVPISAMAPALLFLWVLLMYVAIYPVAMAVRATNVYEEKSLGVYNEERNAEYHSGLEPNFQGPRREVFSKYLAWHLRKQLAFDIWPLAFAAFIICIAERGKILNPDSSSYYTIFAIIFECTSAYSTIGLSLGIPGANYSLSGSFSTISKLVIICVMLRGRHRGLPIAIDRAILLPTEYARIDRQKTIDRRNSSIHVPGVDTREEVPASPWRRSSFAQGSGQERVESGSGRVSQRTREV